MTEATLYERLGGEGRVLELVTRFYDHMEHDPDAKGIRDKHPENMDHARKRLFEYFTGWFGGPPLYISQYGHPRLRARHLHIQIGTEDRDAWLRCLYRALDEMELDPELYRDLDEKIAPMADHMRNLPDEAQS
ncbi:MAG: group II truncated hemoglobin [Pseudomonadales bacterium]